MKENESVNKGDENSETYYQKNGRVFKGLQTSNADYNTAQTFKISILTLILSITMLVVHC